MENNPVSLYWDEASIGYEAYSVVSTGKDMHGNHWFQAIFPGYGDYKAPVYIWLTALALKILPIGQMAVRVTSVVSGSLSLIVVYFLAKEIFVGKKSNKIALWSMAGASFLPWHIHFSRVGFEANLGLFFIGLALLMLLMGRRKKWLILLSSIFGVIGVYSYFSVRIVFPLMVLSTVLIYFKQFKNSFGYIFLSIALFLSLMIPLTKSTFYDPSNQIRMSTENILNYDQEVIYSNYLRQDDGGQLWARIIHHRYLYIAKEFTLNLFDHLSPRYLFISGDPNLRHGSGIMGLMLPSYVIIFFLGIFSLGKNRKQLTLIMLWWLISLIPASIPEETPHALRSLNGVIPMVMVLGVGMEAVLTKIHRDQKWRMPTVAYLLVVLVNLIGFVGYYFWHYPTDTAEAWQDGYRQVAEFLNERSGDYDSIVVSAKDRLYLYVLFFTQYPPERLQAEAENDLLGKDGFVINRFGKYNFKKIMWPDELDNQIKTLLLTQKGLIPDEIDRKGKITNSRNEVIFEAFDIGELK